MKRRLQTSMKWPIKLTLPSIFAEERVLISLADDEEQRKISEKRFSRENDQLDRNKTA